MLQAKLDSGDEPPPLLHPGMAKLYRQKVSDIAQALEHPDTRTEAAEAIRGLIDEIVLTPDTHPSDVEYGAPSMRLTEVLVETTRASSKPAAAKSDRNSASVRSRPVEAMSMFRSIHLFDDAVLPAGTTRSMSSSVASGAIARRTLRKMVMDSSSLQSWITRFEDVKVAALGYSFEEAAANQLAPIADTRLLLQVTRPSQATR